MTSIDNQKLFQQYYQNEYDFNTSSLTEKDVDDIKQLVKEKRVNYALAPIGEKIFDWISEQVPNIRFELVEFESEKIDGMLYIPQNGSDRAYIILNSKKPFINQIFTTVHEYYHYIRDYSKIKETPYICNFTALENVNEKRASRFAAEFLLPEEALRNEIRLYRVGQGKTIRDALSFDDYATICIYLTIKYQLPLKAAIYRLYEENYIKDINDYIDNYNFMKNVLQEVQILKKQVEHLYSCENQYLTTNRSVYRQMKKVYEEGLASREEIMNDAELLNMDMNMICGFFEQIEDDEDEDDSEMLEYVKQLWGK